MKYTNWVKIGDGGMGSVYKAFQPVLNRWVAIKKIHPHLLEKSKREIFIQRFKREAEIAAQLDHPNIVHIYDFGEEENFCFIAMEYLRGQTLAELLEKTLPLEIGLMIIKEVGEALAYAHQQGVIHRDIKPANIFITEQGGIKLMDFGLAKISHQPSLSQPETVVGTPYYLAPEQIMGEKLTPQTDIFSLGVVLYEVGTGELPWSGKNVIEILNKITGEKFPPVPEKNPQIPPEINRLIEKCLKVKKEERIKRVEEVIETLQKYLKEHDLINSREEIKLFLQSPEKYADGLRQRKINLYLKKGEEYFQLKDKSRAYGEFQKVLALDPGNQIVLKYLAGETQEVGGKSASRKIDYKKIFFIFLSLVFLEILFLANLKKICQIDVPTLPPVEKIKEAKLKEKVPPVKINREKNSLLTSPAVGRKKKEERKIADGYLKVICTPLANIYLDGKSYGETLPVRKIRLKPGWHQLKLTSKIAESVERKIKIEAGREKVVEIELKSLPAYMKLQCPPQTKVYLNGNFLGETPFEKDILKIPAGQHLIKCVHQNYQWEKSFYFKPGVTTKIVVEEE